MYGLIIAGIQFMITEHFGDDVLEKVMAQATLEGAAFSSHERYSERIAPDLLRIVGDITGKTAEEIGMLAGRCFVQFICKYGYGDLLKVMGRRLGDFLKGLDNLHEYFRFSYPKIRPPSFYCDRESSNSLILHYRSRRKGYISYVMGQLKEIALMFYEQDIEISVYRKEERGSFQFTLLKINFDNSALQIDRGLREKSSSLNEFLPVDAYAFLSMFPFYIVFNKKMEITLVGNALLKIMPDIEGKRIDEEFELQRPLIKFSWDGCRQHLNNIFKMESTSQIEKPRDVAAITFKVNDTVEDEVDLKEEVERKDSQATLAEEEGVRPFLETRGPIVYLRTMEVMLYLPTITVNSMDQLFDLGLFLDDYSTADCNREIIMASAQKPDELKTLLNDEKEKSKALESMVADIDVAKKQARELLEQMMPKDVAKMLVQSETGIISVCQSFTEATIAFAKVIDFNGLTEDLPAMEVVNLLNHIYSTFDDIVGRHGVYKVETIGECYMISCGVPIATPYSAEYCSDAALDMVKMVKEFPSSLVSGSKKVTVKIGMFTGPVVGGVVGHRAPRYCLFGNTVNCASRMESHNKAPMTIQMGDTTKIALQKTAPGAFRFESRGKVNLKGKGEMEAFGLLKKSGGPRYKSNPLVWEDDSEEEEAGETYTPINDRSGDEMASRASQQSRMSLSQFAARSDAGSSRSSGAESSMSHSSAVSSDSSAHELIDDNASEILQEELEANQKKAAKEKVKAQAEITAKEILEALDVVKTVEKAEKTKEEKKKEEKKRIEEKQNAEKNEEKRKKAEKEEAAKKAEEEKAMKEEKEKKEAKERKEKAEKEKKEEAPKRKVSTVTAPVVANGTSKLGVPNNTGKADTKDKARSEAKEILAKQSQHKVETKTKAESPLPSITSKGSLSVGKESRPASVQSLSSLNPDSAIASDVVPLSDDSAIEKANIKTRVCALM